MRRFNKTSVKKSKTFRILTIIVLALSIGYAAYLTNLKLTGNFGIVPANVSVVWSDIQVSDGSVNGDVDLDDDATLVSVEADLTKPGDYHEFTVVATNNGDSNAMVSAVNSKLYLVNDGTETEATLPSYLDYSFTYSSGKKVSVNHRLNKNDSVTYKVRVEVKKDITVNQLPDTDSTYRFEFSVDYAYATSDAVTILTPVSFSSDSWDTIVQNVKEGDFSKYSVGDIRQVNIRGQQYNLRIANNTTPSACNSDDFSQTACGFVIEFQDVVLEHQMNPYTDGSSNGDGTKGGWKESEMRSYLNGEFYDSLPYTLKQVIIKTKVISGHGSDDTENFTTTDKVYLLSAKEVWNDNSIDTASNKTRQLDYYAKLEGDSTAFSGAIKEYLYTPEYNWWLRSPYADGENWYYVDENSGGSSYSTSSSELGVSPAFRIG